VRGDERYAALSGRIPGFDRVAFHKELNAEALAFFRKHLVDAEKP
jgi:hypothetical protein